MTAQDLKNSILQLAMQGKLVEQRAEEGTARELITQIKAEKEQLVKEKKIKKEKLLSEIIEEEIPFEIPESWEWVRLSDVCIYLQRGKSPKYSDIKKIPVIAQKCNQWDGFQLERAQFIAPETLEKYSEERLLQDKDVLINSTGLGTVGRNQIYSASNNPYGIAVADSHITVVRLESRILTPEFFFYYWRNPSVQLVIEDQTSGSTKQKELALVTVQNYLVPIPPLAEQKRIVAKIEEILPYIEQYNKAYTKLETFNKRFPVDIQKSILQYAMQGKLVEQKPEEGTADELYEQIVAEKARLIKEGKIKKEKSLHAITEDEIPYEIPDSWKWVSVNDIAFVTKLAGFEYTKYMADAIMPYGEVPIVRAKNIKPNSFMENENEFITMELSDQLSRCALDTKCVLMTFIGAGIGEVAVFDNIRRNHLAPNVAKIVPYVDINYFLMYYLMSAVGQLQIFQYMKQTAQPSLSMEVIRKVLIPLPPLAEQKRIVQEIEKMMPYCQMLAE